MSLLTESFWFLLPAMAANFCLYLVWAYFGRAVGPPLDGGLSLGKTRVVGDSRTLIGLPVCIGAGLLVGWWQGRALEGLVLGIGVDLGTVLHSYFKRRLGIAPGESHHFWDHIDFCLGALLAFGLSFGISVQSILPAILVGGVTHYLVSLIVRPVLDPE